MYKCPPIALVKPSCSLNALLNLAPQLLAPLGNSLPYIWACYPSLVGTEILDVCEGGGGFRDREVVNQLSEKKLL